MWIYSIILISTKAVNDIAWSNAMTEAGSHTKFQAAYHMDGERLLEGHALLQGRYQQLIRTITVDNTYDFSRELLGESLNGIQVSGKCYQKAWAVILMFYIPLLRMFTIVKRWEKKQDCVPE